jgi:rhamnosyl/mannosyltransferase
LRVCHLGKFYPPASGGIETHVRTLALAQAQLGADVQVVCVNHRDRRGRDVTWGNFAVTPTVRESDGPIRLTRVGRYASLSRLDLCADLARVLSSLAGRGVDLLHLHVPNPTMLLTLALVRPPMPLVITYHSDVVRQRWLGRLIRPVEHRVFRRASAILVSSPAYAAGSEMLQIYPDRTVVVPFGIDLRPYLEPDVEAQGHAVELRRQHGQPLWLVVGRLVYYKGLHNAIQALRSVPGRLLVIGAGPLGPELRRLARRTGVAERVIWRGRVSNSELVGAYHAATALWFPSNARSEAFGFVQVEAMASGCPVLNTAIPDSGVAWVSRHDDTGLTVPLDDVGALARAANRLLHEPGLRDRLGLQARRRSVEEFGDRLMAQRSLAVYCDVLEAATPLPSGAPTWVAEPLLSSL